MAIYNLSSASPLISNQFRTDADDTENVEKNASKRYLGQEFVNRNICPFKLQWSFGINLEVPVINLSTENCTLVAYACSHVAMIYDYSSKKIWPLQGHQNAVKTLSTTKDGRWLLTADFEKDCIIVVWNTETRTPVRTIFNPHGSEGMTAARISPNAKQIVTVGNEKCQKVHFWLWTFERDKPDASFSLTDTMSERVKEITFNDECPEQFALTTDYHVLFLFWNGHTLNYDYPRVMTKVRRTGIFNGSCYVPKMQQVLTVTTTGCVLLWSNVSYDCEHTIDNSNFEKKHIKTVNLQKSSITVIVDYGSMLIMGNSDGRITFYDYRLRLLYWCQTCDLDSIRWISFDVQSNSLASISITDKFEGCKCRDDYKITTSSTLTMNIEHIPRNRDNSKSVEETVKKEKSNHLPMDTILRCSLFNVRNFLACSATGVIVLIDIPRQNCHLISRYPIAIATSLDTHPNSNYVVVGDKQGHVHLYNYEECTLIISRSAPPLPNFRPILEEQMTRNNFVYITCPQTHESLKAITALKFSPRCDMLVCGLENGAIWILHHITLECLDEIPYKHSSAAINKIIFSQCAKYMAYADNALTVVVFKRNDTSFSKERNIWNLIGKYHSHYLPIRNILFGPVISDSNVPRFFSLGEDQELVEYDLEHSGPYPTPGLKILHIDRIEQSAVPLCLAWYPESGIERFLMVSNSEYKYKIFNDVTKTIRGTYLGPIFGEPVQYLQVLTDELVDHNGYMVFATDKEIGLQLLPLDGNPYKIVGMTGHPQKITDISVNHNKQLMFTIGHNDPCVLMWKIIHRSVDIMARLGGEELLPFYCLIKGGKKGWLMNKIKDLFYYVQITHQGECTNVARTVSNIVVIEQIPNLMRAIGYYPSNEEIQNIVGEVCYKYYAETGKFVEEINFEEFVRLYVNHRPALGLSMRQIKEAFHTFTEENFTSIENPTLTRAQFMNVLLGATISETSLENHKSTGEPLTLQEAYTYLRLLVCSDEGPMETHHLIPSQKLTLADFHFLPLRISYKEFAMDIMGIELPERTGIDN